MFIMQIYELLDVNSVCIDSTALSQTAVLLRASQLLNQNHPELHVDKLFEAYWKRESMGSTAIGHGIIIPHVRSEIIEKSCGVFLRLQHPVDFGAEDKQPIDLVLALVMPHQCDHHLKILTQIVKRFSNPTFRSNCRNANDAEALYALLIEDIK